MPASRAKQAETAGRRADLIRLRRAGRSFDSIAAELGYASRQAASKDFIRPLEQRRDEQAAEVSVYRQEENERLDALLEAAWPRATQPSPVLNKDGDVVGEQLDMRAVDTVLRLMDRRAKLNGLDTPVRTEVTGAGGGPLQMGRATAAEREALIGMASGMETPSAARDVPEADEGE